MSGCLKAFLITFAIVAVFVGGVAFMIHRSLTNFDAYRDQLGIREQLEVEDEHLWYSPGMDAILWCRFTVTASGIGEVFDPSRVDVSEFDDTDYKISDSRIRNSWWDADRRKLTGGKVDLGDEFLRVGYADNGDGTLTVYIYWFEV